MESSPRIQPLNPTTRTLSPGNTEPQKDRPFSQAQLGGSWVVISGVISIGITINITDIRGLIPTLITTHEPPRKFMLLGIYTYIYRL